VGFKINSGLTEIKPAEQGAIIFYLPLVSVSQARENKFIQAENGIQIFVRGDLGDYEGVIAQKF